MSLVEDRRRPGPWFVVLVLLMSGCLSRPGPEVAATPQRPTFSSDTNTTAPGAFELESGVLLDREDFFDTPTALKYGASERSELFLGWSPYQVLHRPGPDGRGGGDVVVGARTRLVEERGERPSFAVQLRSKLPTASEREGLGTGEVDTFVAAVLSRAVGPGSVTLFYEAGALGEANDTDIDVQHGLALSGGLPVADRLSAFGEVAGVWVHEQRVDSIFATGGLAFSPRPGLVLDAAVVAGLSDDAPDFQFALGFTWTFGQILGALGVGEPP